MGVGLPKREVGERTEVGAPSRATRVVGRQ